MSELKPDRFAGGFPASLADSKDRPQAEDDPEESGDDKHDVDQKAERLLL
jgi:hypothetical protein